MNRRRTATLLTVVFMLLTVTGLRVPSAAAQPANDDFSGAVVIGGLPFSDVGSTAEATESPDDPAPALGSTCGGGGTVWYNFTPAGDTQITANTFGSSYDTTLGVYTGGPGGFSEVTCNDDFTSFESRIDFTALAGVTYNVVVGTCCGSGAGAGAEYVLSIDMPSPPPANDDIGDAIVIPGLDFSDTRDTSGATEAPDDPGRCFGGPNVWYAFTPAEAVVVQVATTESSYFAGIDVYVGSPGALNHIACGEQVVFVANPGETYFILVSGFDPGTLVLSATSLGAPIAFEVSIDGASVDRVTGAAIITGTATCSHAGTFSVDVFVEQRIGRAVVRGNGQASGPCDGPTPWTAEVRSSDGAYKGGRAAVSVHASGCDSFFCDNAEAEATMRLSGH